jgi:4-hydroxy-tetrahydrodipicolinate reductase
VSAPLRVGVHGATGRVGRLVVEEIDAAPDLTLAWACGRTPPEDPRADVIVDFSTPEGLRALLTWTPCPVVTGTTGGIALPDAPRTALLHAANFSLGVAVLARLARDAARALPGWDVEIVELHHTAKRDAPSGTALRLADAVDAGRGTAGPRAHGRTGPHHAGETGLHAVRGGDIVGEHTLYVIGRGERLQLGHVATDRALFARGALRCARWLAERPPGRYTLEDVLG